MLFSQIICLPQTGAGVGGAPLGAGGLAAEDACGREGLAAAAGGRAAGAAGALAGRLAARAVSGRPRLRGRVRPRLHLRPRPRRHAALQDRLPGGRAEPLALLPRDPPAPRRPHAHRDRAGPR